MIEFMYPNKFLLKRVFLFLEIANNFALQREKNPLIFPFAIVYSP